MEKMNVDRMMGKSIHLLSHALNFQSANHEVISGNLANIDTPGFRPKEISFDKELQRAVEKNDLSLQKTNPKHFSHYTGGLRQAEPRFEIRRSHSDQLNIDREMAKMMQNNLLYEASTRLLSKKFEALKTAIDSGRG